LPVSEIKHDQIHGLVMRPRHILTCRADCPFIEGQAEGEESTPPSTALSYWRLSKQLV